MYQASVGEASDDGRNCTADGHDLAIRGEMATRQRFADYCWRLVAMILDSVL